MPSFSLLSAFTVALSGLASATPLLGRQSATCNPNFEGAGVSVITGNVKWAVDADVAGQPILHPGSISPNATANWLVEQTGSAIPTYLFKYVLSLGQKVIHC